MRRSQKMVGLIISNLLLSKSPMYIKQSVTFSTRKLPVLTLFTKEDCTLCDNALEVLKPYSHQFELEKVDITLPENKEWYKKYRYDIPVFHLNGQYLMKHRTDLQVFLKRMAEIEGTN
ncbi:glutaredoxin-like protein C5orf63 homolog [Saccostrea echinata]|uniref:glutaredoxin-like protein C5orf63 homolog n=1 Tax=Saccostrea echinata TaxID=191078 RepID=UPI002A82EF4D|nr:glutaredoxin-like protein C5orf63 homolog [Saccostrea echinata]